MRPIKLTMSAFGPYSTVESIDFAELQSRNLFLITGPTGSGKTTIFDAISYALYGKASGDLRTEDNLRSHFSEADLLTEVTLVFELNKIIYKVHRIPKQMRPKARTEGYTEQKPEATLTIGEGESSAIVAGISKVNQKIEAILGINEEQFKQIMMIPQGEFRKLLTSDSQEREKVLQQLFDTYAYRKVQLELSEKAKVLGTAIKREKVARDTLITQIKAGDDELLGHLIKAEDKFVDKIQAQTKVRIDLDENQEKLLAQEVIILDDNLSQVAKEQNKAIEDNKNLDLKRETQKAIAVQENRQSEMDAIQLSVEKAEVAARLVGTQNQLVAREKETSRRLVEQEATQKQISALKSLFQKAEVALEDITSQEAEAKQNKRLIDLADYEGFTEKVRGLEALEASVKEKNMELENLKNAIDHHKMMKLKAEDQVTSFTQELDGLKDVPVALERLKGVYQKVVVNQEQMVKLLEALEVVSSESAKGSKIEGQVEMSARALDLAQKAYKEAQLTFLLNQAAILSKELKHNEPCPVCGALSHPSPAKVKDELMTKATLEVLELKWNKAKVNHDESLRKRTIHKERITNYINGLNGLIKEQFVEEAEALITKTIGEQRREVTTALERLANEERQRSRELESLSRKNETIDVIKARLVKGQAYILSIDGEIKTQNDAYLNMLESVTKLKTDLTHVYEAIPEDLRKMKVLDERIRDIKTLISKHNKELLETRRYYEELKDKKTKEESKNQQLLKFIQEETSGITVLWKEFDQQVVASGFADRTAYEAAKREPALLKRLKESLNDYKLQMVRLKENLKLYQEKTEGVSYQEMKGFDDQLVALKHKRQVTLEAQGDIKASIRDNKEVLGSITKINDLIRDKELKYNVVGKLARIAQGNNPAMMTFERYVLAAFLEDILIAANLRLRQMTQGRYLLSRTSELQRKNKQSGLELEVFDNFTGKSRHVKTLSGGESFKASLSMALGLSDVVQSYAGGVRLDTMFIDEGFGTLDQESLDSAIDCLIDLQKSGRLVGIISHVQELKERIDTRLEISSSNKGSETRFILG